MSAPLTNHHSPQSSPPPAQANAVIHFHAPEPFVYKCCHFQKNSSLADSTTSCKTAHLAFLLHVLMSKFYDYSWNCFARRALDEARVIAAYPKQCEQWHQQSNHTSNLLCLKVSSTYSINSSGCCFMLQFRVVSKWGERTALFSSPFLYEKIGLDKTLKELLMQFRQML